MRLTLHTDYALRVLVHLALAPGEVVSVATIAETFGVSRTHLGKVAGALARAGFVESARGRGGGIRLARNASQIGVGAVVRALEPDLEPVACLRRDAAHCTIAAACDLKDVLALARDAFLSELDRFSLADVSSRPVALRGLLNLATRR